LDRGAAARRAHLAIEPIQEYDVPPELPEPQQILEKDPAVSSAPRLLRKRSGNDDGLHDGETPGLATLLGRPRFRAIASSIHSASCACIAAGSKRSCSNRNACC